MSGQKWNYSCRLILFAISHSCHTVSILFYSIRPKLTVYNSHVYRVIWNGGINPKGAFMLLIMKQFWCRTNPEIQLLTIMNTKSSIRLCTAALRHHVSIVFTRFKIFHPKYFIIHTKDWIFYSILSNQKIVLVNNKSMLFMQNLNQIRWFLITFLNNYCALL